VPVYVIDVFIGFPNKIVPPHVYVAPGTTTVSLLVPIIIWFDRVKLAPYPIAVDLLKFPPLKMPVSAPRNVLYCWISGVDDTLTNPLPELIPIAVLYDPLLLPTNALIPIAVLQLPLVVADNANAPTAVF
jgi:hypothetical protein